MWTSITQQNTWRLWYANIFLHSTCTPPPSNSHHQHYYMFIRESQPKPAFVTGILGGGVDPTCICLTIPSSQIPEPTRFILQPSPTDPSDSQHHVVLSSDQSARQFSKPAPQSYLASDRLVERLSFLKLHTLKQGQIPENARKNHWE